MVLCWDILKTEKCDCVNEHSCYSKYRHWGLDPEKLVSTRGFPTFLNTTRSYNKNKFITCRHWVWSNKRWNFKNETCWVQHWCRKKCYECWWYRRISKFLVAVIWNIFKRMSKKHNSKNKNNTQTLWTV